MVDCAITSYLSPLVSTADRNFRFDDSYPLGHHSTAPRGNTITTRLAITSGNLTEPNSNWRLKPLNGVSGQMAVRDYDRVILSHYREVAQQSGRDATSTMADERTRQLETELICDFVATCLGRHVQRGLPEESVQVVDVGCGNGYTLEVLADRFPAVRLIGFEYTPELCKIAQERFAGGKTRILPADIRESNFAGELRAKVLICQRVLINLLDPEDQVRALNHIVESTEHGAHLLFIEAFQSGLDSLNAARSEFDLEPIPPAHHNIYLPDQFFSRRTDLEPLKGEFSHIPSNFLSTHYFVSRVFHPAVLGDRPMKRNSHWVRFFSESLVQAVGDYSPVRALLFKRL